MVHLLMLRLVAISLSLRHWGYLTVSLLLNNLHVVNLGHLLCIFRCYCLLMVIVQRFKQVYTFMIEFVSAFVKPTRPRHLNDSRHLTEIVL